MLAILLAALPLALALPPAYKSIVQFPNGTFVENIGVRADGSLLLTTLTAPEVWRVDPATGTRTLLVRFGDNATSTSGLAEVAPGFWAVNAGQLNMAAFEGVRGSHSVHVFDATGRIAKSVPVPDAKLLNGLACCDVRGRVLTVDTNDGVVYAVDVFAGAVERLLDGPAFAPPAGGFPLGANGRARIDPPDRDTLWFSNSARNVLSRVSLRTKAVTTLVGPVFFGTDDFALVPRACLGTTLAFVAHNSGNELVRVARDGTVETVPGALNSTVLPRPSSAQLSRDGRTLYVTTLRCGRQSHQLQLLRGPDGHRGRFEPSTVISR